MLAHYILRGSALFCNSLHFHEHVNGLVQDCANSSALATKLLQSCTKQTMYCYRKPVLTSWVDKYTNGRGEFMQAYAKKYVGWLHFLITLCTSQGSHVHTLFLRWYAPVVFQIRMEKSLRSLAFQPISNCCKYGSHSAGTVLIQQVPFSGLYIDEQVPSL